MFSIARVALGAGVLIVVIAVMSGFEKRIKDEWLKVEPPLYLIDEGRSWMPAEDPAAKEAALVWSKVLPKVKSFPGVQGASPFINVVSLLQQAPPKEFDDMDIKVDPGSIPPPEPPSEPGASQSRTVHRLLPNLLPNPNRPRRCREKRKKSPAWTGPAHWLTRSSLGSIPMMWTRWNAIPKGSGNC